MPVPSQLLAAGVMNRQPQHNRVHGTAPTSASASSSSSASRVRVQPNVPAYTLCSSSVGCRQRGVHSMSATHQRSAEKHVGVGSVEVGSAHRHSEAVHSR